MSTVLKLDVTGQPRGWLTINEAVLAYARSDVLYGIGDPLPPIFGGIQRSSGVRSRINLQPIIALEGRVFREFVPQTTVEVSKLLKSCDKGGILKSILGFRV